ELEESQKQLRAQQEISGAEQTRLAAQTQELQAAKPDVVQQIERLTEMLAQETRRREETEQQADETCQLRQELEAQMGQLRQELETAQKELWAQQEISGAEQTRLATQTQELQAAKLAVEQQVARLTETLCDETRRREDAERQAGEIGNRRSALEAELSRLGQELEA